MLEKEWLCGVCQRERGVGLGGTGTEELVAAAHLSVDEVC